MQHLRSPLVLSGRSYVPCPETTRVIWASAEQRLTLDAYSSAIFDETKDQVREPIVQCVQVKPLPPQPGHPERYRAVFSDIANYVQTMLATRMLGQPHRISLHH